MEKMINELWKAKMKQEDPKETMRKDIISHHALRLVYCRGRKEKWFLSMETNLFKYRFKHESPQSQIALSCYTTHSTIRAIRLGVSKQLGFTVVLTWC